VKLCDQQFSREIEKQISLSAHGSAESVLGAGGIRKVHADFEVDGDVCGTNAVHPGDRDRHQRTQIPLVEEVGAVPADSLGVCRGSTDICNKAVRTTPTVS
jgi:hypothetical protein